MDRWSERKAVVTGASSGIGAAVAVSLANHGLTVIGLARRDHVVDELNTKVTGKGKIYSRQCDVSNPEEVASAFQWINENHGGTDILLNNAGIFEAGRITDLSDMTLSESSVLAILDTNFKGMVLCARHAIASMKRRSFDGHIVNVSSVAGHYIPFNSYFNVYSSTKHAVNAFSTALLNELAEVRSKIKVTNVSPGLVRTGITVNHLGDEPMLEPVEVAEAILYILSTPPHVNIYEFGLMSSGERRM